jgi:hypothetical protein
MQTSSGLEVAIAERNKCLSSQFLAIFSAIETGRNVRHKMDVFALQKEGTPIATLSDRDVRDQKRRNSIATAAHVDHDRRSVAGMVGKALRHVAVHATHIRSDCSS